jgi:3-methyladenine DNA glycosylase AlkD
MDLETILKELESLSSERTKKQYMQQGAHEPLFGVATGAMKPIAKQIKGNQVLADKLYHTGNYDAMYLAGMIADVKSMTEEDFNRWMEDAYFYMISDYIVAVTLSETDFAQEVSDKWIETGKELYVSAGYSCYCWLLGSRRNEEFNEDKLNAMLQTVEKTIYSSPDRVKYAMNNFVITVGVSYVPLHEKAVSVANGIGTVILSGGKTKCHVPAAAVEIQKAVDKGRLGFKRKYVRC